ncbi:MAG: hypothetical protein ACI861_001956 [Paracoccaceae bacterium]|jgi:hypothetical protein
MTCQAGQKGRVLALMGSSYDRITGSPIDATTRLKWLSRGDTWNGKFYPQPYVQLAKVLREMGHERDARQVLFRLNILRRQHIRTRANIEPDGSVRVGFTSLWADIVNGFRFGWDYIQRFSIGYGLKPMRSLYVLMVLFLTATTLAHLTWDEGSFAPNSGPIIASGTWQEVATVTEKANPEAYANPAAYWSAKGRPGQDWESFNRYAYGADVVIPIIQFGQTDAWAPSTERGPWGWHLWWARWVLSVLGWLVTALAAAAVTGIIKRD